MNLISLATTISRPRFWLYLAGPYLIGVAATGAAFYRTPSFWLGLIFFLVPANLFLYGINDYYDADTDQLNPKKQTAEHLLAPEEKKSVRHLLYGTSILYLIYALGSRNPMFGVLLGILWLLSYAYSAPPVRLKKRPFLDSLSNVLYIIPALIGYAQFSGHVPSWPLILAGGLWAAAMHLFSAIPDIVSDREAGLTTTAVYYGKRRSLIACSLLWSGALLAAGENLFSIAPWSLLTIAYPFIPLYILMRHANIVEAYWWFPAFNALNGALLFFGIIFQH